MLYSDLRDEVILEVGDDLEDSDLLAEVLQYIKSALRRFPQNARARSIISKKSVSLSAAAITASLPSGFIQERQAWYETSDGERIDVEIIRDTKTFNDKYRSASLGAPEAIRIYGTTIELNRTTDAAYTLYIDCFVEIDDIAIGDTVAFDSNFIEILKDGVKFYYFTNTEEETQQAAFGKLFTNGLVGLDSKYQREELPDHAVEA